MHNTLSDCLGAVKKNKRFRISSITVLLVLSLLVSANVFWGLKQTGLTLAGTAACGYEEHTHSDECYNRILICAISDKIHTHGDGCYKSVLVCQKTEHVHKLTCYSDKNADAETFLDWQKMFSDITTGDMRRDLVSIALSQVGYKESTRNFEIDKSFDRHGYTRYGAWYGAPYADWSAMFVSFCLNYAGYSADEAPRNIGVSTMQKSWQAIGQYAKKGDYSPAPGDLVFFSDSTVGIITSVNFNMLSVVKGDVMGEVCEQTVSEYSDSVVGYGTHSKQASGGTLLGISSGSDFVATDFKLADCDCGSTAEDIAKHSDNCARKKQLVDMADTYSVEQLYTVWTLSVLDSDEQAFIIKYLTDNAWKYGDKAYQLQTMIGGISKKLESTVGGATFVIEGDLPEGAVLDVSVPDWNKETQLSCLNPNITSNVNWFKTFDISIKVDGEVYTPTSVVKVTVTLPDIQFDAQKEFFAVAHVDADTQKTLSSVYVEVDDNNTLSFVTDGFSPYVFYAVDQEVEGGERVWGTNWIDLKNSDFFTYWQQYLDADQPIGSKDNTTEGEKPSRVQVDNVGGTTTSDKGDDVEISKVIAGTDIENVFDITLTVTTSQNISEIIKEPDMAVVIVMDISNTMTENFGNSTRYKAAMEAAEDFLDKFAETTNGLSKIGYVAFNTDAHEIFGLSECSTGAQATALKDTMRKKTGDIINASEYGSSHKRFTNVEAGLKRASDMLAKASNEHKYIIFLSDGFPTTYIESGYTGYDTYDSSGRFYDHVFNRPCLYGTSYSDEAAIRARKMAASIKASGTTIFSIGVDVGGQTIQQHINNSKDKAHSIVDRTGTTYEIGDATSEQSYKDWLKNSIGSGYYYDSTNTAGLKDAYNQIFEQMKHITETASEADWVANDPLPLIPPEYIEFIGFFDKDGVLQKTETDLSGENKKCAENTAKYDDGDQITQKSEIYWDLKKSGYEETKKGDTTYYSYKLKYRVRLKNELKDDKFTFEEEKIYDTNAPTTLKYRVFEEKDGKLTFSEQRTLDFKIPSVHGYLADITFTKKGSDGRLLAGAEFMLEHDDANCTECRGDGTKINETIFFTEISDKDGNVTFANIPSGHKYILTETKAPPGYAVDNKSYHITIAYDIVSYDDDWTGTITNFTSPELPGTGGGGELPFILAGLALIAVPVIYRFVCIRRRKREGRSS